MNGHTRPRAYRILVSTTLALLFAFTLRQPAAAQDLDEVSFSGVVTDERGAVVPGALVTARPAGAKAGRSALTDGAGRYRLVELPPGAYALAVTRDGFAAQEVRGVRTLAGDPVRLDFVLRPAGVAAEQTVRGDAPAAALDAGRVVAGGSVEREELERLPSFSRSPLDAVLLLGGATEEPLPTLYS